MGPTTITAASTGDLSQWVAIGAGGPLKLKPSHKQIDPAERAILDCLGDDFVPVNLIASDCNLTATDTCQLINTLKAKGQIAGRIDSNSKQWEIRVLH